MVHPTQQRSGGFGRKPLPSITIDRGGKITSFKVRPVLSLTFATVGGILLCGYIAATAYLIYRDDLLGGALARQVRMQYAYEERIADLRSELDRVTSRQAVEALSIEEQVAILLDRQAEVASRQSSLDRLLARADEAGIEIAAAALPRPRPQPVETTKDAGLRLGYLAESTDVDVIGEALIDEAVGKAKPGTGELKPKLDAVQSSLDQASLIQSSAMDALTAAAAREAERLSAVLAPIGIGRGEGDGAKPQGGPFIPAGALHFVERAAILNRSLDDIDKLRHAANDLPLRAPVEGGVESSRFGYRMDPFLQRPAMHAGIDFVAAAGTGVRATAAGAVVSAGWSGGYGKMVEIRHPKGLSTRYGHLSTVSVETGDRIDAGALIGRVGSTGRSTGPHLHYETRRDGSAVNPAPFLRVGRALDTAGL